MAQPRLDTPQVVEDLLDRFTEHMRTTGEADFSIVEECPPEHRKELTSLCNMYVLAWRATADIRAFHSSSGQ